MPHAPAISPFSPLATSTLGLIRAACCPLPRLRHSLLPLVLGPIVLALFLALTPAAFAQASKAKGTTDFLSTLSEKKVTVRVLSDAASLAPGDNAVLAVVLETIKGWKVNTSEPQVPESWGDFAPIPTTIQISQTGLTETKAAIRVGSTQWPKPQTVMVDLVGSGTPVAYEVYKDKVVAFVPLLVESFASQGSAVTLKVSVGYQACDDTTCDAPLTETFEIPLQIVAPGTAARSLPPADSPDANIFTAFDASAFARLATGEDIAKVQEASGGRAKTGSMLVINDFGLNLRIDTAGAGFALVLLIAAVGGFLLNLMPCVLPVIPIKIIGLQKSTGSAKQRIILGLVMSAGVIAFWLAVGSVLGLSNKFIAGSQLFSIWWFAMGIGVFIFVMGLGMLGVFDVGLPNWVYSLNPKHDSAAGSFGFGILTAVLALPCVAPFMGTAMSWALGRPFGTTLATFGAIGVGMALPYAILSIAPKLVAWLPRTGPASDLLKQVMGLLMVAVSVFFISTGISSLTQSVPYLSSVLHWWLIALLVAGTCVWLVVRTFAITKSASRRSVFTLLAMLLASAGFFWANTQTEAAFRSQIWKHYSSAELIAARQAGKTIILDFTANWCLNCKTLSATVLSRDEIIEVLGRNDVVPIEVDLTSTDAPGWELLRSYGQTGIPLLVVEGPGTKDPWFSNAYTPANVLAAIAAAKGK